MKQENMVIKQNKLIALNTFEMVLTGQQIPRLIQSGQFVHVQIGDGKHHVLRRPISVADINETEQSITLIYHVTGEGTRWFAAQPIGTVINVLGPLGNGFNLDQSDGENILIIGGGVGIPPLYHAAKQLAKHHHVIAILGFATREAVFYEDAFQQVAETYITTDDGSYGYQGVVTDLLKYLDQTYQLYYACGPTPMLKVVQEHMNDTPGYLSLEERMGCGNGACFACVCEAQNDKGYVKICQDGPVLSASEVIL